MIDAHVLPRIDVIYPYWYAGILTTSEVAEIVSLLRSAVKFGEPITARALTEYAARHGAAIPLPIRDDDGSRYDGTLIFGREMLLLARAVKAAGG